ncbi:hypothetical protein SAMN04489732_12222 [Amycolatopsis saalfeldensis]|uniref:Uncharacterized protein n=1 Tax=Amycolatopsis saalfeldensis TaxID=394193 RepID=A0A1H8YKQ9_9PSEU|nr:hypothetical protein SAMN04489732_12222 [Amycolatopsis saalfeldensis]
MAGDCAASVSEDCGALGAGRWWRAAGWGCVLGGCASGAGGRVPRLGVGIACRAPCRGWALRIAHLVWGGHRVTRTLSGAGIAYRAPRRARASRIAHLVWGGHRVPGTGAGIACRAGGRALCTAPWGSGRRAPRVEGWPPGIGRRALRFAHLVLGAGTAYRASGHHASRGGRQTLGVERCASGTLRWGAGTARRGSWCGGAKPRAVAVRGVGSLTRPRSPGGGRRPVPRRPGRAGAPRDRPSRVRVPVPPPGAAGSRVR